MGDSRAKKILIRTLVGGGLVAVLALALWWVSESRNGNLVFIIGWVLSVLAAYELHRMGRLAGHKLLWVFSPVLVATGVLAWLARGQWCAVGFKQGGQVWQGLLTTAFGAGILVEIAAIVLRVRTLPIARGGLLMIAVLGLWVALPLSWLGQVWWAFGVSGLVALLVLSKIGDIAGYYVGNAMGKTHPFPNISPGKTTAGCVGSLVVGIAAGGACVAFGLLPEGRWGIVGGCLAGLAINLAAQAGDLFESWVKRQAGVKDSGTWFGPSGGVLDLVDSLLFSVPVALLTWPLLFPGGWFPDGVPPIVHPS